MKNCPNTKAERHRRNDILASRDCSGTNNGAFEFGELFVIASDGDGWDHVSVSRVDKTPSWEEMCFIKGIFFKDDEVAMQLHPAKKDYINQHPYCLHLWRPQTSEERKAINSDPALSFLAIDMPSHGTIPLPPPIMVGVKS